MPDARLRDLERTLAEGDASVRPNLAREYMRLERVGPALAQLLEVAAATPDLIELEQRAWRIELAELKPLRRVDQSELQGPRWNDRVWRADLVGWFGAGRFAVFSTHHPLPGLALGFRTLVFDLQDGRFVLDPEVAEYMESRRPLFVTEVGVVACCDYAREHPFLIAPTRDGWNERRLGLAGQPLAVHPNGTLALTRDGLHTLEGVLVRQDPGTALCWSLDLCARGGEELWLGPILAPSPRTVGGVPGGLIPVAFLEDGRLLCTRSHALVGIPPHCVVDADRGEATPFELPPQVVRRLGIGTPLHLSSDGRSLLVPQSDELPMVLSLGALARPRPWPPAPRPPLWHPRADVFVRDEPEGMIVSFAGEPISLLDADASPLGWTPDGRGLLVQRRGLEVWTPRGEPLP